MRAAAVLLLIAPFAAPAAEPEDFAIDPVHTRVMVAVGHADFSRALGTVSGATGRVRFSEGWAGAQVDVTIPLARLDFGDAKWNAAVQGLLGTAKHPEARFTSDRVTARDATHAEVCGTLRLRDVARPLCMEVTFNALKRHPLPPFRRTAGFSATAHLDRTAFGVDQWATVIGRDVEIRIEIEATRTRSGASTSPETKHE
ncbi:YceI family protein [Lysobacter humi (ex Lee et al. 2017)]